MSLVAAEQPEQEALTFDLDAGVRQAARRRRLAALKAEGAEDLAQQADQRDEDGQALVVRQGAAEPRPG